MRTRLATVDSAQASAAGDAIASRLAEWPAFRGAPSVALFASLPGEVDSRALASLVLGAGKRLLLPRVRPGAPGLDFVEVSGFEELRPGRYGVAEPSAQRPVARWANGDLLLVPGLAFDLEGGRLGRGGGYYDRAFSEASRQAEILRIGVAFAFQVVDAVPMEAHDMRVDAVLTERGLAGTSPDRSIAGREIPSGREE